MGSFPVQLHYRLDPRSPAFRGERRRIQQEAARLRVPQQMTEGVTSRPAGHVTSAPGTSRSHGALGSELAEARALRIYVGEPEW